MERLKAIEGMEQAHEPDCVELKCNSCGGNLIMSDKGLSCPNCDKEKKLVVKRNWYGCFDILEAKNVFASTKVITAKQMEELSKQGVDVNVLY